MKSFMKEYVGRSQMLAILALILRICAVGVEVYIPLRIKELADTTDIVRELVVLVLLTLTVFVMMILANRFSGRVAHDVTERIEAMFIDNEAWRYESSLSSLSQDLGMLQQMLCSVQRLWVKAPIMLMFALIALGSIDILIAFICLMTVIVLLFGLRYITRDFSVVFKTYKQSEDTINKSSVEVCKSLESAVANQVDFGCTGVSDFESLKNSEVNKVVANGMLSVSCSSWYVVTALLVCTIVVCNSRDTNTFALSVLPVFMYLNMILNSCQGIQRMLASATRLGVIVRRLQEFRTVCMSEGHKVCKPCDSECSSKRIIVNGDDELLAGNVEFNIRFYRKVDKSVIEKTMQELDFVNVFDRSIADIRILDAKSLSSGQRQMVLLARGMVHPTGCTLKNCLSSIDKDLKSHIVSILTKGGIDFE